MSTLMITGGTGYLGERLLPIASMRAEVVATARSSSMHAAMSGAYGERLTEPHAWYELDITDAIAVKAAVEAIQPDAIIHAAAINPGVDDKAMRLVNVDGTRHVAQAAAAAQCRLVTVSTDVLHDGRSGPYADASAPSPINLYGQTKAEAEAAALGAHENTIAVRTSLIYGLESMDRGTRGFADRLARGESLTLFADVLRQPVWRDALAHGLVQLALDHEQETGLMLNFWQIPAHDRVQRINAAGREEFSSVPLDCRVSLHRAERLGLATPGVQEVLSNHPRSIPCR